MNSFTFWLLTETPGHVPAARSTSKTCFQSNLTYLRMDAKHEFII